MFAALAAEIVCSFPSAGQVRAATVLGAMGTPVSAFHSHKALRRHLGSSVDVDRSGNSVARERLTRSGNRHARREIRMWAWCPVSPRWGGYPSGATTSG
jgi:transposase